MSSTKSALNNTFWLFGERSVAMALMLLVNVVLARYLSPEQFGQLNYLISFLAILVPFSAIGLNALVTRELVTLSKPAGVILGTTLLLRILGGVLACFLVVITFLFFSFKTVLPDYWFLLAAMANTFTACNLFEFYFQAKVASRYVVKVRLFVLIFSSITKLIAVCLSADLNVFLSILLFEPVITALLLCFAYKIYVKEEIHTWQYNKGYGLDLLKQSRWLMFSGFLAMIYLKIDQLMLGQMVAVSEVGIYAIAARLSEVWYFFPVALVSSFFPKLLQEREIAVNYEAQLQRLCDVLFWSAVLLAIVITLSAKPIVTILFGEEYAGSASILKIHIWAGIFIFMRALLSKWFIAENLLAFSLITHGVAATINVLLNFCWIPIYSGEGAAWATLVSYACSSYFVLWFNVKTRPMALIMTKSITAPIRF